VACERRQQLAELATGTGYEAAELTFPAGRFEESGRPTKAVLDTEPFYETAWCLASAHGGDRGALGTYQRCEQVLAEVGAEPAATTASSSTSCGANQGLGSRAPP
jgi:DNA-binding SARP family transcriptional activator